MRAVCDIRLWKFPARLLMRFQNRVMVEIVLIEHYREDETAPLESIEMTLTPRYTGHLPKIYAAAISLTKHLGIPYRPLLPVMYRCVLEGLLDQWLYLLRPSDSISFLWMMSGMMLVFASVVVALILYKSAGWLAGEETKRAASSKTPPRAESVSGRGSHPMAGSPSASAKCDGTAFYHGKRIFSLSDVSLARAGLRHRTREEK